jgi:hypothetical protein
MLVGQVRREGRRRCRRIAELAPLGGAERPRRVVRFARLIQRPVRVLGGPTVRAAFGGILSMPCLLLSVVLRMAPSFGCWTASRLQIPAAVAIAMTEAPVGLLTGQPWDRDT